MSVSVETWYENDYPVIYGSVEIGGRASDGPTTLPQLLARETVGSAGCAERYRIECFSRSLGSGWSMQIEVLADDAQHWRSTAENIWINNMLCYLHNAVSYALSGWNDERSAVTREFNVDLLRCALRRCHNRWERRARQSERYPHGTLLITVTCAEPASDRPMSNVERLAG